jgi:hypothetical protein
MQLAVAISIFVILAALVHLAFIANSHRVRLLDPTSSIGTPCLHRLTPSFALTISHSIVSAMLAMAVVLMHLAESSLRSWNKIN